MITNTQKPNYSGNMASGARGKQRPLNTEKEGVKMIIEFTKDINEKLKTGMQKQVPAQVANKLVQEGSAKIIKSGDSEVITKDA